jgi:hypothetical protein
MVAAQRRASQSTRVYSIIRGVYVLQVAIEACTERGHLTGFSTRFGHEGMLPFRVANCDPALAYTHSLIVKASFERSEGA